ncbi:MAG: hypothetical protein N4A38_00585 [Candidatus Gracilibacteria bacterium]|nr:hypothetical protein [Candidatus Gracilibacteria bacterium]
MNTKEIIFSYFNNFNPDVKVYSLNAPTGSEKPLIVFNREYFKINFLGVRNEKFEISLWTEKESDLETLLTQLVTYIYNTNIAGIKSKKIGKIETISDTAGDAKGAKVELFLKFKGN